MIQFLNLFLLNSRLIMYILNYLLDKEKSAQIVNCDCVNNVSNFFHPFLADKMNLELLESFGQNYPEEYDGSLDCISMAVTCQFNRSVVY